MTTANSEATVVSESSTTPPNADTADALESVRSVEAPVAGAEQAAPAAAEAPSDAASDEQSHGASADRPGDPGAPQAAETVAERPSGTLPEQSTGTVAEQPVDAPVEPAGSEILPVDDAVTDDSRQGPADTAEPAPSAPAAATSSAPAVPAPTPAATAPAPPAAPPASPAPAPVAPKPAPAAPRAAAPSPAQLAARPTAAPSSDALSYGRVAEDGTVFVRTPEGEKEVGSYPGATPEEALAYFARKYDDALAHADLLLQRVTQTDLSAKEAGEGLARLREQTTDIRAVGDLVALQNKVETIATAVEARRAVENADRAAAREATIARREEIVAEAEKIAAQDEAKIQWKASSGRMRELLEEWKTSQRSGAKLDRETEQAMWHRLSAARNSFDRMRRVHFAHLTSSQSEAKAAKEDLVKQAEALSTSTEWAATAGAYKRLMDSWRQAGRASRQDDDALWARFKKAQDAFFTAKDAEASKENAEFSENLKVKEALLVEAQALLPVTNLEAAKKALRGIQDRWDAAGKVPRSDMERIERAMRKVEASIREADDRRWQATNPELTARAQSMVSQLESAIAGLRDDLAKAEAGGDQRKITKAKDALAAREAWLEQARRGL